MRILKIDGASTDDERAALREVIGIWETGGACSDELLNRLPSGRVEVHVAANANNEQLAVIVIENGIVGFHPLDEPGPETTH
jgi:hypothetical protein